MSARKRRITLSEDWKERIKVGEIMSRLNRHVMGECEMKPSQINAARLLLAKVAPDLRSIEHSGETNFLVTELITKDEAKAINKVLDEDY